MRHLRNPWVRTILAAVLVVGVVLALGGCQRHHRIFVTGKYQNLLGWYYVCNGKYIHCYKYNIYRVSYNVYRQAVVGEYLEWDSGD